MARRKKEQAEDDQPSNKSSTHTGRKRAGKDSETQGAMDLDGTSDFQHMLSIESILKQAQKKDNTVSKFQAKVSQDQKNLKDLLQQESLKAAKSEAQHRDEIAATISKALLHSPAADTLEPNDGAPASLEAATQPTFESAKEAIHYCRGLVQKYENISRLFMSKEPRKEQRKSMEWQRELDRTKGLLELGKMEALKKLEEMIGDVHSATHQGETKSTEDEPERGSEETFLPSLDEYDAGIQKTLRYAERGIKRLTKGLPDDKPGEENDHF